MDFIGSFLQDNFKHSVFGSWTVDRENNSQNIPTILEDYCDQRSQWMEWLITESYLLMNSPIGWYKMSLYYKYAPYGSKLVALSYFDECVYWYTVTSEELGKFFLIHLERYSMWTYRDMHIGLCSKGSHKLRTILFHWIMVYIIHLLLKRI